MKSKIGKEVFIKELSQYGTVKALTPFGEVKEVIVTDATGKPNVIDVLEKGYTLLTIFAAIWELLLKAVNIFKK